jgi:glycosyltransferase involved in cell wall biosynthesis
VEALDEQTKDLKILVMIPTYNDPELVGEIARQIENISDQATVLVIDDGSDPSIRAEELDKSTMLVCLPTNFGLGMCMHVALDHQIVHGYDVLIRVDGDGQHPVESIPELIAPIVSGKASFVVGSRANRDQGTGLRSFLARFVRDYMSTVVRLVSRNSSPVDVTSGFIALDRRAAKVLNQGMLEQYPEPQMCLLIGRSDLATCEIRIDQKDRAFGRSTITVGQALRFLYRFNIIVLASLFQSGK